MPGGRVSSVRGFPPQSTNNYNTLIQQCMSKAKTNKPTTAYVVLELSRQSALTPTYQCGLGGLPQHGQAVRLEACFLRGSITQFPRGRCALMRAPLVAHVPWWPAQGRLGQQEFQIGSKNFGPQHAPSMPSTPSTPPVEWYSFRDEQSSEANYIERATFGAVTNPYPSGCPGMTAAV